MKKKNLLRIICLIALMVLCCSLTACGLFGGNNSSTNNAGNSGSGNNSKPTEENDGTFIYSGASIKAANTSISGEIKIPSEHNGTPIDTIPEDAFKGCNAITSIEVPNSIMSIGRGAFNGCSSIRSITLPFVGSEKGNSGTSAACFGYIFGGNTYQGGTRIYQYWDPTNSYNSSTFYIPSTLRTVTITNETVIARGAFQNCSMLTKIELNDEIIQVGTSSFASCSKIEEINLPSISIITSSLFSGCISLKEFIINDSVDTIGGKAFEGCSALSKINSEEAGTFIIPNQVTSIGSAAFNGCSMIRSITLPFVGSEKGNSGTSAACFGYIFGGDTYQGGTRIYQYWDPTNSYNSSTFYIPSILRTVTITNETVIARGAFQNCSMLESIKINSAAKNQVATNSFEKTANPEWVG